MKIAFILEEFPILSQTFVLNQITGLIDRGCEIDIYAQPPSKNEKIHPDFEKYNLKERIFYHPRISENDFIRLIEAIKIVFINFFKDPGLILNSLNFLKLGKSALALRTIFLIIPFLGDRKRYDIIYCHFGGNGLKGMLLKNMGAIDGKLVTVFHGVDMSQKLKAMGEHIYDSLFKEGDLFLPVCKNWQQRLIEIGCNPEQTVVHHMGIDCQKFTFIPRVLNPEQPVRLISIARLTEKKGIEYGIRAVAKILKHHANVEYIIVGDGEIRPKLNQLIQELGVAAQVKLLGWRNQREVVALLNESHILLAPSVTAKNGNQEGVPVALMEAMAMGLPVVSTYHSGIPELVEDGVCGFLVPEHDVDALADKLHYLVQNPQSWVEMSHAGRLRVEEQFNISKLNDRLICFYQDLLEVSSPLINSEPVGAVAKTDPSTNL